MEFGPSKDLSLDILPGESIGIGDSVKETVSTYKCKLLSRHDFSNLLKRKENDHKFHLNS